MCSGKCCIKYNVCETPSNSFEIGLSKGETASLTEEYCPKNFVFIEGGTARGSFGTITNRYCGAAFNSIPFIDQSAEVCGKYKYNYYFAFIILQNTLDCTAPFQVGICTEHDLVSDSFARGKIKLYLLLSRIIY